LNPFQQAWQVLKFSQSPLDKQRLQNISMQETLRRPTAAQKIQAEDDKITGAQLQHTMGLEEDEEEDNTMRLGNFASSM